MPDTKIVPNDAKWMEELTKSALKYHKIGAWVAITFNLVFSITDWFVLPSFWWDFFIFRASVSVCTLVAVLLRNKLKLSPEVLIFIPLMLISVQNAYMWSFMGVEELQQHAFAYIALFIGSGMLILWRSVYSLIVVGLSIPTNIVFFYFNSELSTDQILANGGLLTGAVMGFSIFLIQTRYNLTKKEIVARLSLEASNVLLNEQKEVIAIKNKNILDSINYAKRIQQAILPPAKYMTQHFKEHFVLFKPKDIVSGDFYWFGHKDNKSIIIAADCTGHGVPGAFMSMIGNSLLNKLIVDFDHSDPSEILFRLRGEVIAAVSQGTDELDSKDGMDIALCVIDHKNNVLKYAGAYNPLYLIRNGVLTETKADRMPIGKFYKKDNEPFTTHVVNIAPGDQFYIFSDGFPDQFGGETNRKIGSKRLKEKLVSLNVLTMSEQLAQLDHFFEDWKGERNQLDDVLLIGFKL